VNVATWSMDFDVYILNIYFNEEEEEGQTNPVFKTRV